MSFYSLHINDTPQEGAACARVVFNDETIKTINVRSRATMEKLQYIGRYVLKRIIETGHVLRSLYEA